jgi:hypothetical protein
MATNRLSDLTDPRAVQQAMDEFDRLGRDAFLEKYEFGRSKSHFARRRGKLYDSKAIAHAALRHQYPGDQPATFSGGERTVAARFRALGVDVLVIRADGDSAQRLVAMREKRVGLWTFRAKPSRYRVYEAVRHREVDWWTIGEHDVRAGDDVVIWQAQDKGGRRGIVGFGKVLGDPEVRTDQGNPYWVDPKEALVSARRVPVAYAITPNLPLWMGGGKPETLLGSLSAARAQGGTVFRLTEQQWAQLKEIAPHTSPSVDEVELERAVRNRPATRSGQGFGLNSVERRVVEKHAMRLAIEYFKRDWHTVTDVSANSSFDLSCQRGADELRVEVKGTTTAGAEVILTRKEVAEAERPGYALFVVSDIAIAVHEGAPRASGGAARVFLPWVVKPEALVPICYKCAVDLERGVIVMPERA